MGIEYNHFIGVTKEADSLACHLYSAVVHLCYCLDGLFDLLGAELDLGVRHYDRGQLLSLRIEILLLSLEVLQTV